MGNTGGGVSTVDLNNIKRVDCDNESILKYNSISYSIDERVKNACSEFYVTQPANPISIPNSTATISPVIQYDYMLDNDTRLYNFCIKSPLNSSNQSYCSHKNMTSTRICSDAIVDKLQKQNEYEIPDNIKTFCINSWINVAPPESGTILRNSILTPYLADDQMRLMVNNDANKLEQLCLNSEFDIVHNWCEQKIPELCSLPTAWNNTTYFSKCKDYVTTEEDGMTVANNGCRTTLTTPVIVTTDNSYSSLEPQTPHIFDGKTTTGCYSLCSDPQTTPFIKWCDYLKLTFCNAINHSLPQCKEYPNGQMFIENTDNHFIKTLTDEFRKNISQTDPPLTYKKAIINTFKTKPIELNETLFNDTYANGRGTTERLKTNLTTFLQNTYNIYKEVRGVDLTDEERKLIF